MTEIIVITHGNLAQEFITTAEAVLEKKSIAIAVGLEFGLTPDKYATKIEEVIKSVSSNSQIIILTDLFGGSPSNLSIPFIKKGQIEVITGLNLPILLFLLTEKDNMSLADLCLEAKKIGEEAIVIAGEFLT